MSHLIRLARTSNKLDFCRISLRGNPIYIIPRQTDVRVNSPAQWNGMHTNKYSSHGHGSGSSDDHDPKDKGRSGESEKIISVAKHQQLKELSSILDMMGTSKIQLFRENKPRNHLQQSKVNNWTDSLKSFNTNMGRHLSHTSVDISKTLKKETTKAKKKKKKAKKVEEKTSVTAVPHIEHIESSSVPLETANGEAQLKDEMKLLSQDPSVPTGMKDNLTEYLEKLENDPLTILAPSLEKVSITEEDVDNPDKMSLLVKYLCNIDRASPKETWKDAVERALHEEKADKQNDIHCYVSACVDCGKLSTAQVFIIGCQKLMETRGQKKKKKNRVLVMPMLKTYNLLIRAWAERGQLNPIKVLLTHLSQRNVNRDVDTYSGVLLSVSHMSDKLEQYALVEEALEMAKSENIHLTELNKTHIYSNEQIQRILKMIHLVDHDFTLSQELASPQDYDCRLLNHLNTVGSQPFSNPMASSLNPEEIKRSLAEQCRAEESIDVVVDSILAPPKITSEVKHARDLISKTEAEWKEVLSQQFIQSRTLIEKNRDGTSEPNVAPFLRLLDTDSYVNIMMREVRMICQDMGLHSPPVGQLFERIGSNVSRQHFINQQRHKLPYYLSAMKDYLDLINQPTMKANHRKTWLTVLEKYVDKINPADWGPPPSSPALFRMVGRTLYNIIITNIKIDGNLMKKNAPKSIIPAFYTVIKKSNMYYNEEVMPHPVLCQLFRTAKMKQVTFSPIELPSLIPPVPWTSHKHGADIFSTVELIRHADEVRRETLFKTPLQKVLPTLDALNTVGACSWIINRKVLDVMVEVFKTGGSEELDVPCSVYDIPLPPKIHSKMSFAEKNEAMKERRDYLKRCEETYSLWCTMLYRLSIANKFADRPFWYASNVDFRGRVYATSPHLNHLGSDLSRGIMVFGQGRPLGSSGLDWVKIHCINLSGLKKRSPNSERLAYANEIMDDILDSADHPLTGSGWWKKADEPWQTLATCMEIAAASRSPDPKAFVSHLPVHQDGSCNGLQHYAALGRDVVGANSINLHPRRTPRDVYSDVVELVEKVRAKDANKGNEIAKVLAGHIQRKVIKQTIMTTVYGVTIYGARLQIQGQLEDLEDFPQEHVSAAKNYLTTKTLSSLEQMFTSARQIQDWFVLMANLVTRVRGHLVSWKTPLGWPVVQYYASRNHPVSKYSGEKILVVKPNFRKQMNAFPPNFIHSLDASHMMLTAIHCQQEGIAFASVHDCFWTHPCHIAVMNKICREQFVSLHNYPILEELSDLMLEEHGFDLDNSEQRRTELKKVFNYVLTRVPSRGEFKLEKVLNSTYFFS